MEQEIEKAIRILKNGGVGIFPTDTAFAIGCRIDDEKAVGRLFDIKGRAAVKATPVLVDGIAMAQQYLLPISSEVMQKLLEKYWPGALTVVMSCLVEKVPSLVRGGGDDLGVRMPDGEVALQIISGIGVPILGTSANFAGGPTPYKSEDLDQELVKRVDFVLPGICPVGKSSTVIDVSVTPWKVMREGAIIIS